MSKIKRLLKAILPYGIATLHEKARKRLVASQTFTFEGGEVIGWLEPAHIKMRLNPSEWVQREIVKHGCYDGINIGKLLEFLPEGGVFFDIGSNIGAFSFNACRKASIVYAFDATEETYNRFQKMIDENEIQNISLFLNAVHSVDGETVKIYTRDAANLGANSMFGTGSVANTVQTITLDSFAKQQNLQRLDVIKIDIEGNELNAFKGATEVLARFRPVIFCEVNRDAENNLALYDFIVAQGYSAHRLQGDRLWKIRRRSVANFRGDNIFFLSKKD
jgi:FkbM family methyltransferase